MEEKMNPPQTDTLRAEALPADIHAALRELTTTVTEQKANIRALETRLRDREIAFSASLMESGNGYTGPFTTDITLTYKNVFTNIGKAYNPITGIFTAPLKGAYMFSVSVYGHGGAVATASIVKNGEKVVSAHDVQPNEKERLTASNGVVLILGVGDVVYVRLWSGNKIHDDDQYNVNTFSGYLLFPLH